MRSVRREEKNNQTTNKLPIFLRQPLWNFTIGRRELPQGSTEEWIPGQNLISKTENRPQDSMVWKLSEPQDRNVSRGMMQAAGAPLEWEEGNWRRTVIGKFIFYFFK